MKNYEYYPIRAEKCIKPDSGNEITGPNNDDITDVQYFKVRATSHTQHIWSETRLDGLSKSAEEKIKKYRDDGYSLKVGVGSGLINLNN
jgi:hypothetical protein